jgi:Protein of unknown function (DUF3175)
LRTTSGGERIDGSGLKSSGAAAEHAEWERTMTQKKSKTPAKKRWVQNVKTVSTFPGKGLFTKDAKNIARGMASKKVSPKGIGSGIRMIQYFINRGGKGLTLHRKKELEKAKRVLQEKLHAKK